MRIMILGMGLAVMAAMTPAQAQLDPRSTAVYRQCRGMGGMSMDECVCMAQAIGRPRNETLITMLMQGFPISGMRNPGAPFVERVHAKGMYAPADEIYAGAGTIVAAADFCQPEKAPAGGNANGAAGAGAGTGADATAAADRRPNPTMGNAVGGQHPEVVREDGGPTAGDPRRGVGGPN